MISVSPNLLKCRNWIFFVLANPILRVTPAFPKTFSILPVLSRVFLYFSNFLQPNYKLLKLARCNFRYKYLHKTRKNGFCSCEHFLERAGLDILCKWLDNTRWAPANTHIRSTLCAVYSPSVHEEAINMAKNVILAENWGTIRGFRVHVRFFMKKIWSFI